MQFAPSAPRKSAIFRPFIHPCKLSLAILLGSLQSNTARELTLYAFRQLIEKTQSKNWMKTTPLRNMCRILNKSLQSFFNSIRGFAHVNKKKIIVATLFNLEFRYAGLSADRIRQLNLQIE